MIVATPERLTRRQRIAISIRGQSRVEAEVKSKSGKVTKKKVSWSLSVPLCDDCSPALRKSLGCQRFDSLSPKVPHRIDYDAQGKAPRIAFCHRSYDDHALDAEVVRVISEIDKEGLYSYYNKALQRLPNRTMETIQEVRAAWARVHEERDALERNG